MKAILVFSITFLLVLFSSGLTAQEKSIYIKSFHAIDGLSDDNITAIIQDKYGFIWVGTKDGLNRFDGKEFQAFRNDPGDSSSISSNYITCLEVSEDSLLWVGTANTGLCSYDFKKGIFRRFSMKSSGLLSNYIYAITFDKHKGGLWVGQNNGGLSFFDFQTLKASTLASNRTCLDIAKIDTAVYVAAISRSVRRVSGFDVYDSSTSKYAITVNVIFQASDGKIWCGAWDNGLHLFDGVTRKASYIFDNDNRLSYSGDEILSIAEGEQGLLWLGTRLSGLRFFNVNTHEFAQPYIYPRPFKGRINCLFKDRNQRIWVGSANGLHLYDPLLNQFNVVMLNQDISAEDCPVNGRLITNGGLDLVISPCGLYYKRMEDKRYEFKSYRDNNINLQLVSVYQTSTGKILIGTNKSVYFLDTLNFSLSTVTKISGLFKKSFQSIYSSRYSTIAPLGRDDDSLILIVAYGHEMFLFNRNTEQVFNIGFGKDSISGLYVDNLIRKIFTDSHDRLFLCGASRGIQQFFMKQPVMFNKYFYNESLRLIKDCSWKTYSKLDDNTVNDIFDLTEMVDGSYWASSQGNGLLRFFPDDADHPFVSMNSPIKSTMGITAVNDSALWMITSKGFMNYNVKSARYILYSELHGLPSGLNGYFYKGNDGTLTAGFGNGYVSITPEFIRTHTEKPSLFLTKYWVMDELHSEGIRRALSLNYDRNFLRFYMSSNVFSFNEQNEYHYFLEGIDRQWRSNGSNPLITYTNLPPGNYTFHCIVLNSSGVASEPLKLNIAIVPPFYATWWFYFIIAIFSIVIVYVIYRYRLMQQLKLQSVRDHIARDLHDDIGSTLGSIHIYSQVAKAKLMRDREPSVEPILDKIEESAREIIDKTSDTVWFVKSTNDSFHELFIRMEGYIAALFQHSNIRFNIVADSALHPLKLDMTTKRNLFLIYKEALHNIAKYANASEVDVLFELKKSKVKMIIKDNGKGFDRNRAEDMVKGNGLGNMEKRAIEMRGKFNVITAPGQGTTITIDF